MATRCCGDHDLQTTRLASALQKKKHILGNDYENLLVYKSPFTTIYACENDNVAR